MKPLVLALAALLVGCQARPVVVRVTIPDVNGIETPAAGLVVAFLPYDRDSILASLEAKAPSPRPHTAQLDSLYQAFREPFQAFLKIVTVTDRLKRERDSLIGAGAAAADRLRLVTDSLTRATPGLDSARRTLDRVREQVGPSIDRLREEVRLWQDSTFQGYGEIVRSMGERVFANPVADTTDAGGWGSMQLTKGQWWATTTNIDPNDPHREWYWNVKITGDTVWLSPQTGRNRPRY